MKAHFAMFARYNEWANRRLYDAVAKLPDADYRADHGAFFGSVHRTLNHILVTDRIWMNRFTKEGPTYAALDAVPCADLSTLRGEREAEDRRIVGYVDTLSEDQLAATFTYTPVTNPKPLTQPLSPALAHLFNHQTHHRGQVHGLLTALAGRDAAPPLDLIYFQRETSIGLAR